MCRVFVMEMGPWTDGESHRRECLSVDPNSTVADLRALVGNTFAKQPDNFQLIHLGTYLARTISCQLTEERLLYLYSTLPYECVPAVTIGGNFQEIF